MTFERFTERARQAITLGQEAARERGHNYIGAEHIAAGLLRENEGVAARVLRELGVTDEAVFFEGIPNGDDVMSGQIPFTPRARKVLELALREALSLGHNYVGTEHVLLGLVRAITDGPSRPGLGASGDDIRDAVLRHAQGAVRATATTGTNALTAADAVRRADERTLKDLYKVAEDLVQVMNDLERDGVWRIGKFKT
jgi:ATP-dependent Clp protease ATP-binding subunit ClpC